MFQRLDNHESFLYHYTKTCTALDAILPDRQLRISTFRRTNDPKESKEWKFNFALGALDPSIEKTTECGMSVSKEIKRTAKVLCFSKDRAFVDINPLNEIFSRGFAKPRMWVQYGDAHKGVCLVFNKEVLFQRITFQFDRGDADIYSGSVIYVNRSIVEKVYTSAYTINYPYFEELGLKEYIRRHIYTHYPRLFFEKTLDWRDEDEFRWVVVTDSDEDLFLDYGNALAGIAFGESAREEEISAAVKLTKQQGIRFEKMEWKNCTPWLSFRLTWA